MQFVNIFFTAYCPSTLKSILYHFDIKLSLRK